MSRLMSYSFQVWWNCDPFSILTYKLEKWETAHLLQQFHVVSWKNVLCYICILSVCFPLSWLLLEGRAVSEIQDHMLTSCGPLNRAAMGSHYGCGELYGRAFGGTHPSRSVLWEFRNTAALLLSLIMQPHFYNSAKWALYPGFLQPILLPVFWVAACC